MRSIEDTLQEIDEQIMSEEDNLADIRRDGHINTYGAGYSVGVLECLRELRLWIMEAL